MRLSLKSTSLEKIGTKFLHQEESLDCVVPKLSKAKIRTHSMTKDICEKQLGHEFEYAKWKISRTLRCFIKAVNI